MRWKKRMNRFLAAAMTVAMLGEQVSAYVYAQNLSPENESSIIQETDTQVIEDELILETKGSDIIS